MLLLRHGTTILTQENRYNGDDQRVQKTENGTEKRYHYQDGTVSYLTDADGEKTLQYLLNEGSVLALEEYKLAESRTFLYNKDIQNSTVSLLDEDLAGTTAYEYDAFGETVKKGADSSNEVCYTGGIYDAGTGLYYLNARYYDPKAGRFLTQDTYHGETDEPDSYHLYAYCANDPVNYVDPSGHKYSINNAVTYARKWAKKKNPKYKYHEGHDCTNFVSQCLHAGGKAMKKAKNVYEHKDIYNTSSYWYSVRYIEYHTNHGYYRWKETTTWIKVVDFYNYWKKRGAEIITCKTKKILQDKSKKGDIVQVKPKGETWNHSLIITGGKKGDRLYCGHSYARKDRRIADIKRNNNQYRIIRVK